VSYCRGFRTPHDDAGELEHVYWDWPGIEYWPSEYDLCSSCADQLEEFLFVQDGGWRRPLHYSRSWAERGSDEPAHTP
jgi:hypothetical protein